MREDLPEGEVSLLLTDIEGSTRLLHRLGAERYADALADHRRLLRDAFSRHRGVEVDNQGDAFFIAFPTPHDCFLGAVSGQRALAQHAWQEDRPVRVRMGMHTGEPRRTDEGYVGHDVHEAARIAAAGYGGQILISSRTAERLTPTLETGELALRDLGEHNLKDIDSPRHLYQALIPDLPSDFPELNTQQTRPNNLPTPPTPFVGRAELVRDVVDLMLQNEVRLITLTGPGGTGKSRLGLRAATDLLSHFPDGAFFVPLAAVLTADLVPSAIASALGIKEGQGSLADTLAEQLADKELLLLIDNFEQVQQAAGQLAQLLSRCPKLKMLVTSREALRVSGGRGFPVPPLELPAPGRLPPVEELTRFEAVRLFVDRVQAVRPDFELNADNAAAVIEICRRVDGLPLALELAASRMRSMEPGRLAQALDKRLKVLKGGAVDLLDHQRTLRDLIAWSYDMLTPEEQQLWRRLSVFTGGAAMEAAQAVCDTDDEFDVELDVESLVEKSLVTLEFPGGSGVEKVIAGESSAPRIVLLETLREFAFDQLEKHGEAVELLDRHGNWFLEFAEQANAELRGAEQDTWLARLEQDHGNIRAAMARALTEDLERAQRFGASLWFFWFHHGYLTEGRGLLEQSLAGDETTSRVRALALLGLSNLDRHQNLLSEAEHNGEAALTRFRALDDQGGIADALGQLGAIAQHQGDLGRSEALLMEAERILRDLGSRERLSFTLNLLGSFKLLNGNLNEAATLYEESRNLGLALDDHAKVAHASVNLGEVRQMQGDLRSARALYREGLAIYLEAGMKLALAYVMEILAGVENRLERPELAARLFGAADAIRVELDSPIEPFNEDRYDEDIVATRRMLGDEEFESAYAEGSRERISSLLAALP